ncbi:MAG: M20/M25/M40 family metallo-hydrolase [Bacteroidetes bacterium]|jgi:glutamate carboxypeptidase|nr:M20/M25/M40 family metallo-hydrolase [Bacteroidota bacterium]
MINKFFIILLALSSCFSMNAQLNKIERKIVNNIDANTNLAIDLLKEVVNINSGSLNLEGVKLVGEKFAQQYRELGFDVKWIPGESFERAGHMVATHVRPNVPKILLIGHLDTLFEPESSFQEYKIIDGHIMHGPGALDMKGGNVIMFLALKALKEAKVLDKLSIEVFLVGDEELSGSPLELSKKDLIQSGKWADIAIGFEDGDGKLENANISRRGSADWTLTVKGEPAHSSQIFQQEVGSGAIFEAARILNEFYSQLSKETNLTFNPGIISGGNSVNYDENTHKSIAFGKNNIVSAEVIVKGDIRAVSREQLSHARKVMQDIIQNNYPKTSAILTFGDDGYPPMTMTQGNQDILAMYSKASQDLGFGEVFPVNPRNSGAADISFVADDVLMAIDGIGMCGTGGHTIEEMADLNCLPIEAKRTAILLYRLSMMELK